MHDTSGANRKATQGGHEAGSGTGHVVSARMLLMVFGSLVVLTWATVAATWINLGSFNLWLAMGIATTKAVLVLLFFMHLRWERPVNLIVFVASLLFVLLFVGVALMDTKSYRPDLIPGYSPGMPN